MSAISTKSTSRSQYKTSIYEESSIKLKKNASILLSSKKNQVFSPLGYIVTCAQLEAVIIIIARSTLSSPPYCFTCNQEYIIGREGRVSYSIYYCANALRIIKFEWLTQTSCETHQYSSWVVPKWAVLDQLLSNTHLTTR